MHVHSKYSDHPSEWFLQKLGTSESYSEPEAIFRTALARGMDFVTITDHNRIDGALELAKLHPDRTIVGVESTAYFPEDGTKVHILIYGLNQAQFETIQELRSDLYRLRDFLIEQGLAHAVAHPTYSLKGALTVEHLEKLVLLFDCFESRNGGRNKRMNTDIEELLDELTDHDIVTLADRYDLSPANPAGSGKGRIGGSDDHSGLYVGATYTEADASTPEEFLTRIVDRNSHARGRHHDFAAMAFSIYKIAYDFAKSKKSSLINAPISLITELALGNRKPTFVDELVLRFAGNKLPGKFQEERAIVASLVQELRKLDTDDIDARIEVLYRKVGEFIDLLGGRFTRAVERSLSKGEIESLIENVATFLPVMFLGVPFVSTISNMNHNRHLPGEFRSRLAKPPRTGKKRILWFTDTLCDLNGVSYSLKEIAQLAKEQELPVYIAAALEPDELARNDLPEQLVNLPLVHSFPIPNYEKLHLRIPSLLESLKRICEFDPDEIYISSPAAVGLCGLGVAKLLGVPCTGIYHTDFTLQVKDVIDDVTITNFIETYSKWFFSACDSILMNTREYIDILARRGYDRSKMEIFRRGIDIDRFAPDPQAKRTTHRRFGIPESRLLVFAGRISKDKSVEVAIEAFRLLSEAFPELRIAVAGDGPDLEALRIRCADEPRIHLLGRIEHEELPTLYAASDLFVFPSTTDTFGRVVLEAQACGSPAVVSSVGGPKELIIEGETGTVVSTQRPADWAAAIRLHLDGFDTSPEERARVRARCRDHVAERFSLQRFLSTLTEGDGPSQPKPFQNIHVAQHARTSG